MAPITVTLAAPRTANAPAFFGIIDGDDQILQAAASPTTAIRTLRELGYGTAATLAALRVAVEQQITTMTRPA